MSEAQKMMERDLAARLAAAGKNLVEAPRESKPYFKRSDIKGRSEFYLLHQKEIDEAALDNRVVDDISVTKQNSWGKPFGRDPGTLNSWEK